MQLKQPTCYYFFHVPGKTSICSWILELFGKKITIEQGVVGETGEKIVKKFSSISKALEVSQSLRWEKFAQGYIQVCKIEQEIDNEFIVWGMDVPPLTTNTKSKIFRNANLVEIARKNDMDILQTLFHCFEKEKIDNSSRLMYATTTNNCDTVETILQENNNNPDTIWKAFHTGVKRGYSQIVARFLSTIVELDFALALNIATIAGHLPCVKLLVEHGADINHWGGYKTHTPLEWAIAKGHYNIASYLLSKKATYKPVSKNRLENEQKQAFLYECIEFHDLCGARRLIENNVKLTPVEDNQDLPLVAAIANGNIEMVKLLLDSGSPIEHVIEFPLEVAVRTGNIEIVKLLLPLGDLEDMFYENPVILAARDGHLKIVKLLVDAGGEVNYTMDNDDYTALMEASLAGHLEIVKYLVEVGANVNKKTSSGETALGLAKAGKHCKIVQYLQNISK